MEDGERELVVRKDREREVVAMKDRERDGKEVQSIPMTLTTGDLATEIIITAQMKTPTLMKNTTDVGGERRRGEIETGSPASSHQECSSATVMTPTVPGKKCIIAPDSIQMIFPGQHWRAVLSYDIWQKELETMTMICHHGLHGVDLTVVSISITRAKGRLAEEEGLGYKKN